MNLFVNNKIFIYSYENPQIEIIIIILNIFEKICIIYTILWSASLPLKKGGV